MNKCKHAGEFDLTLKVCRCDINHVTDLDAEAIRTSYMKQFDGSLIFHSPICLFELENSIETCPRYETQS